MNNYFELVKKATINEVKSVNSGNDPISTKEQKKHILNKIYNLLKEYHNVNISNDQQSTLKLHVDYDVNNNNVNNNMNGITVDENTKLTMDDHDKFVKNTSQIIDQMNTLFRPKNIAKSIQKMIGPMMKIDNDHNYYSQTHYKSSSIDNDGNKIIEQSDIKNINGKVDKKHTVRTIDKNGNEIIENINDDKLTKQTHKNRLPGTSPAVLY